MLLKLFSLFKTIYASIISNINTNKEVKTSSNTEDLEINSQEDSTSKEGGDEMVVVVNELKEKILSDSFINEIKKQVFPFTPIDNIKNNWSLIVEALDKKDLLDKDMVCYSLATIAVENPGFIPISEKPSKYSDSDGQAPYNFSKYDTMTALGNTPELDGDGEKYKGRGLIQITGFNNYQDMDIKLNLDGGLLDNPDAANEPHIASFIFAQYMKDRENRIRKAFLTKDLVTLRKVVNGGTIGLDKFKEAYEKVEKILE